MAGPRLTPTLFDKLVGDLDIEGLREDDLSSDRSLAEMNRSTLRYYTVAKLERFNEQALKNTVKRELNWLFNTTNLGAVVDLTPYPQVQRSVVNYGVPDFAGKTGGKRVLQARAKEIRDAIRTFEPRLNPERLEVDVIGTGERENSITYVVRSDVISAVQAMPVTYKTDIEVDTGATTVRD